MSKTILTVDDSISIRQMLAFTLRNAGYEVIEASDGVEAITKLNSYQISLIITDLNMPNLDGIELIKHVRKNPAHRFVPVLMLTTESHDEKKAAGKAAGATGWIVKPFKPEQLLAVIKKVL